MVSNRLAFAALALACVSAAAAGSYLATRQNTADRQPALQAARQQQGAQNLVKAADPQPSSAAVVPGSSATAEQPARAATAPSPAARPTPLKSSTKAIAAPASLQTQDTPDPAPVQPPANTSFANSTPPPAPLPALPALPEPPAPAAHQDEPPAPEPVHALEPENFPQKSLNDLVINADSVIGLQMETAVSSEKSKVEDRVDARVIRDVRVGGEIAIPSGSHAIGSVMTVERGGKFKDRARIGIRFNTLVLSDGTRIPVTTETIYRYGEAPGNSSSAKITGGAVGGAILGAILGGAKGAAIGAAAGAGGGAAASEASDRSEATFAIGTQLTARFLSPVTVTVER